MSKVVITVSIEEKFAEKFIGFLRNLSALNKNGEPPFRIDLIKSDDCFVAYPKDEYDYKIKPQHGGKKG